MAVVIWLIAVAYTYPPQSPVVSTYWSVMNFLAQKKKKSLHYLIGFLTKGIRVGFYRYLLWYLKRYRSSRIIGAPMIQESQFFLPHSVKKKKNEYPFHYIFIYVCCYIHFHVFRQICFLSSKFAIIKILLSYYCSNFYIRLKL